MTENKKINIQFNGGQMINNCRRSSELSFRILNVKIVKQIENMENRNAKVKVGDRIRSITSRIISLNRIQSR